MFVLRNVDRNSSFWSSFPRLVSLLKHILFAHETAFSTAHSLHIFNLISSSSKFQADITKSIQCNNTHALFHRPISRFSYGFCCCCCCLAIRSLQMCFQVYVARAILDLFNQLIFIVLMWKTYKTTHRLHSKYIRVIKYSFPVQKWIHIYTFSNILCVMCMVSFTRWTYICFCEWWHSAGNFKKIHSFSSPCSMTKCIYKTHMSEHVRILIHTHTHGPKQNRTWIQIHTFRLNINVDEQKIKCNSHARCTRASLCHFKWNKMPSNRMLKMLFRRCIEMVLPNSGQPTCHGEIEKIRRVTKKLEITKQKNKRE